MLIIILSPIYIVGNKILPTSIIIKYYLISFGKVSLHKISLHKISFGNKTRYEKSLCLSTKKPSTIKSTQNLKTISQRVITLYFT